MNSNHMLSQRQIRFGEVIRSIISESFIRKDFYDTDIDLSKITVSFVRMSKDLRIASVYIMPLGGKNKNEMLQSLNNNKYVFQKSISQAKLKSKNTPKSDPFGSKKRPEITYYSRRTLRKSTL